MQFSLFGQRLCPSRTSHSTIMPAMAAPPTLKFPISSNIGSTPLFLLQFWHHDWRRGDSTSCCQSPPSLPPSLPIHTTPTQTIQNSLTRVHVTVSCFPCYQNIGLHFQQWGTGGVPLQRCQSFTRRGRRSQDTTTQSHGQGIDDSHKLLPCHQSWN